MKRYLIGAAAGALMFASLAGPALAAKPNNQACLGKDFSGYAREGTSGGFVTFDPGSGFGGFVSTVASSTGVDGLPGAGGEIQNHLAGNVPDSLIVNGCNN